MAGSHIGVRREEDKRKGRLVVKEYFDAQGFTDEMGQITQGLAPSDARVCGLPETNTSARYRVRKLDWGAIGDLFYGLDGAWLVPRTSCPSVRMCSSSTSKSGAKCRRLWK